MPEAVVTATSIRAGTYDLAIGNLFGSNCLNMAAVAVLDVVDGAPSLLAGVEQELAVGALAGILLTGLAILGVLDRAERERRLLDVGPLVMLGVYLAALAVTYGMHG
jgi:cation:H+ antiporter